MNYTARISSKGQITIPAKIRKSLKIESGDRLTITKRGQKVSIEPDSYEYELAALREKAQAQLKKRGLYGASWGEIRRKTDEARIVEYKEKYGIRA